MNINTIKNNKIILLILFILVLSLFRKASRTYDDGYRAGWNGQNINTFVSDEEKIGYRDGLDDAWMYDEGYDDAKKENRPKYLKDEVYMEGYCDAKKYR